MRIVGALVVLCISMPMAVGQQSYRDRQPPVDVDNFVNVGGTDVRVEGDRLTVEGDSLSLDAGDTSINVPETAPSFGVAGVYSSHPCVLGWSGTLSVVGGGIGGGKQRVDPECNLREWSRLLAAYGWLDSVHEIVCSSEDVAFITRCQQPYQAAPVPEIAAPYMAEVSDEEFEAVVEQTELVQDRVEQQANLIASLEADQIAKDAEILRLIAEAEALRAAQEAEKIDKVERQASLADILKRLEARTETTDE